MLLAALSIGHITYCSCENKNIVMTYYSPFLLHLSYMHTCIHRYYFLDITLDFRKPENHPVSINKSSSHLKIIFRELPKSVSKRLSDLSSTKEIFQKATPIYYEPLKKSGFHEPLFFTPKTNSSDNNSKKQRKHKII